MVALVFVQIPAVFIMEAFNITSLMIFKGEIYTDLKVNFWVSEHNIIFPA